MMNLGAFRSMNKELRRIGVEAWDGISGVRVRRHRREGAVTFEQSVARRSLVWRGTVQEALARLGPIASDEGNEALWRALSPEAADAAWRELKEWSDLDQRFRSEFRRIDAEGVHFGGGAEWLVGDSSDGRRQCTISERIVTSIDPDGPSSRCKPVERWSGSVVDALDRLALLSDGAGLPAFWGAFVPELAEEPRVMLEERRRSEARPLEHELDRLEMNDPQLGYSLSFVSRLGSPDEPLTWIAYEARWGATSLKSRHARWRGSTNEALEHLRILDDDASVEEVIQAISS